MPSLSLKPTHKAVTQYYDDLKKFADLGIAHESAVRSAFQELLEHCARQFDWKLVPEYALRHDAMTTDSHKTASPSPSPFLGGGEEGGRRPDEGWGHLRQPGHLAPRPSPLLR